MRNPIIMLIVAFVSGYIAAAVMREPTSALAYDGKPLVMPKGLYEAPKKCKTWEPAE